MTRPANYSLSDSGGSKQYRAPLGLLWWTRRRSYLIFALRELSCIFVAWFVAYMLVFVHAVGQGPLRYAEFLELAGRPWVLAINVLALAFVVVHAVTWFQLAPKAMVVRAGDQPVPPGAVVAAHFGAWLAVSLLVLWVIV
ncbi:fumarate reductase subunit C [Hoyosella sp. YIM 151337]|uniref:fumarate reductase subunit C n=1 Tax=Hoyosella sp. YIM 151337 TaxID=2992742 RepID=UPI0022357C34|nr:fumarate reductase subunit C [Hoyosella sp. YIM 151337]MCW4354371.1 fumarate reductase subunit C [Hoyosella sp. YIM 151337]